MCSIVLLIYFLGIGETLPQRFIWIGPKEELSILSPDEGWLSYPPWPIYSIWVRDNPEVYQLATRFRPYDFIDNNGYYVGYPLWIKGVRLLFFEHPDLPPWTNDRFRIVIYGDDGTTKLYESEEFKAIKNTGSGEWELTVCMLKDSVEITRGRFWIAIKPNARSPNLTIHKPPQRHSFEGRPGNWYPVDGEWIIHAGVNYTPTLEGIELSKVSAPLTLEVDGSPAHHQIEIHYSLSKPSPAILEVFDSLGRLLRRWVLKRVASHTIIWDGTDNQKIKVPNGIYFCRLSSRGSSIVRKMVLVNR